MTTTSRRLGDVTEESTALRKLEALRILCSEVDPSIEKVIDRAVVSSVRRDLCCDRLKCPGESRKRVTTNHILKFMLFFLRTFSPYESVEYSLNVSKVSAHASRGRRTKGTPKRSMWRK